jgi:thiamine biosynthesis lipoprotein
MQNQIGRGWWTVVGRGFIRAGILLWLGAVGVLWANSRAQGDELFVSHFENVLGTGLELRLLAGNQQAADQAEERALAEIDRLNEIFSTYHPESEFSRWQRTSGEWQPVSGELLRVLTAADAWRGATGGAFHPGAQQLSEIWKRAERQGQVPTADELSAAVVALRSEPWQLDETRHQARRLVTYPLTLNAIAKGEIIDQACRVARETPGVSAALVKIGGDLRVCGEWTHPVTIRDPASAGGVSRTLTVEIGERGLATSGPAFRGFEVGGRRWSHLLDPRTGWPVDHLLSVTVVAPTARDADALATAFSVLDPEESLKLARQLEGVQCLLITAAGERLTTPGWSLIESLPEVSLTQLAQAETKKPETPPAEPVDWNGGHELEIKLEINGADGGRRYRRPYVAVWVEDDEGYPVKTLALWVQRTGKGPRWIPDLKRWYNTDRLRQINEETDLVKTMSEPTRKPGEYKLVWDGTDHAGKVVPPGEYTVAIEAAREHGTYQIIRKKLKLDREAVREPLPGNKEIKSASLHYRQRAVPPR